MNTRTLRMCSVKPKPLGYICTDPMIAQSSSSGAHLGGVRYIPCPSPNRYKRICTGGFTAGIHCSLHAPNFCWILLCGEPISNIDSPGAAACDDYQVMPYGLAWAPSILQCFINDVLWNFLVIAYIDDILIYCLNKDPHISHICQFLSKLLYVHMSILLKCL